ncbi:hypothetical protein GpartN1_g2283.t1 [Galdieria partita]|uniref:Uncharacterized protein n=1 Tax=Galdieria partita TaxID=83374 RepID=A0A9C7UPH4_9RHOD|nr:hypothetical protein GpartN1_g2283.t1 [Galdieria partita]
MRMIGWVDGLDRWQSLPVRQSYQRPQIVRYCPHSNPVYAIQRYDLIVIGGGPAGCFAAVQLCEAIYPTVPHIVILERTARILEKVRISGGGRCNVTNGEWDPKVFAQHYPRGGKELIGPLTRFGSLQMKEWLQQNGVELKTEKDGRVFPVSNNSQTIIQCIQRMLERFHVEIRVQYPVTKIEKDENGYFLVHGKELLSSRYLLLSTGSNRLAYHWLSAWGHTIHSPCPSLFTFCIDDARLRGLSGTAVQEAALHLKIGIQTGRRSSLTKNDWVQRGPLLITHWGLSGPVVLRLSAWSARQLAAVNYKAQLSMDWLPDIPMSEITAILVEKRHSWKTKQIANVCPFRDKHGNGRLSKSLWRNIVVQTLQIETCMWKDLSKSRLHALSLALKSSLFEIQGKGIFKEEFVTCGGVCRKQVHFDTMESRIVPNLYFAGEILDIDGVTGGFNLQAAWTTGYLCGRNVAERLKASHTENIFENYLPKIDSSE